MMGGEPPKTCRATCERRVINSWKTDASCWLIYLNYTYNFVKKFLFTKGIWFLAKEHFCKCWSAGPMPQPPTWRTRVSLFVWPLTLILSSKGDPTSSYATTGIALGILEVHKPHHLVQSTFVKVEIPSKQSKAMKYESPKVSSEVLKPRYIYIYICS